MSKQKRFGGGWSDKKLRALRNYLHAWALVLKNTSFNKIYIDAFAGAGTQEIREDENGVAYRHGSPFIALETDPPFDEFYFIEKDTEKISELQEKISQSEHRNRRIHFLNGDANDELQSLCTKIDWRGSRAVAFLDPFALHVEWPTLQAIAATQAVDLWLLFSAMAANRMMPRSGKPDPAWSSKLDLTFGSHEWSEEFYRSEPDLFEEQTVKNERPFEIMSHFVTARLATEFEAVHDKPLILKTESNTPLFLFCFACGNPNGAKRALPIANHIIKNEN